MIGKGSSELRRPLGRVGRARGVFGAQVTRQLIGLGVGGGDVGAGVLS